MPASRSRPFSSAGRSWKTALLVLVAGALGGCSGLGLLNAIVPTGTYDSPKTMAYGDNPRQKLDLYMPENAAEPRPLLVFFYGGRWDKGEREDYRFIADIFTREGYAVAVVDYRLFPAVRFPAFVEDGAAALVALQRWGSRNGGWPGGVFLIGHSAGAHIAALLALDPRYLDAAGGDRDTLAGMVGLAGPYDFLPFKSEDLKRIFGPPDTYARSQPINFVSPSAPPILLLHGGEDQTVIPRNTLSLAAALTAVSAPVQAIIYPEEDHVSLLLSLIWPFREDGGALAAILEFIESEGELPVTTR